MAERSAPNIAMVSLVSGLAGAGLALLFAPRSGKETRTKIQERTESMKDHASESLHNAKETLGTSIADTKKSLSEAINTSGKKSKQRFEELKDNSDRPTVKESPVLHAWEEEV